jgi:hypothetical protein
MASHVRLSRWIRIAGIAILVPVICLFAAVRIQQYVLRWRAERLLADIREIQMGKSTWADAQRLMYRWGKWGGYQNQCDPQYCSYKISIDDVSHAFHHFPFLDGGQWVSELRWPKWMSRPYFWAGGRFAVVGAKFEVRNGKIWAKSFSVRTAFSPKPHAINNDFYAAPDSNVIAEAICATALSHREEVVFSIDDPEVSHFLTDNDRGGHWAVAYFTPFADEGTVSTQMQFNLDCITRRSECKTTSELMPTAASIYKAGKRETDRRVDENYLKNLPFWIAARDTEYVVLAQVIGTNRHAPTDRRVLSFQVTKLLKGYTFISLRSSYYMVRTEGSKGLCSVSSDEARNYSNGTKILVILDEPLNEESTPASETSACVVLPLTDENLATVQRGIARYSVLYPATMDF